MLAPTPTLTPTSTPEGAAACCRPPRAGPHRRRRRTARRCAPPAGWICSTGFRDATLAAKAFTGRGGLAVAIEDVVRWQRRGGSGEVAERWQRRGGSGGSNMEGLRWMAEILAMVGGCGPSGQEWTEQQRCGMSCEVKWHACTKKMATARVCEIAHREIALCPPTLTYLYLTLTNLP
eukprot:324737-Chlamydomonas_euryale.AAC.1